MPVVRAPSRCASFRSPPVLTPRSYRMRGTLGMPITGSEPTGSRGITRSQGVLPTSAGQIWGVQSAKLGGPRPKLRRAKIGSISTQIRLFAKAGRDSASLGARHVGSRRHPHTTTIPSLRMWGPDSPEPVDMGHYLDSAPVWRVVGYVWKASVGKALQRVGKVAPNMRGASKDWPRSAPQGSDLDENRCCWPQPMRRS